MKISNLNVYAAAHAILLTTILWSSCVVVGDNVGSGNISSSGSGNKDNIKKLDAVVGDSSIAVDGEKEELDALRIKRQHEESKGSGGILGAIFNKKLGLFGTLSSISSSSSSSSSKGNGGSSGGGEVHHDDTWQAPPSKPFDWFTFKKTILASLIQAVKAITGGVIALNGQLVKVKGHLLTAKGHFLSTKGDTITSFGRTITLNAFAKPHPVHVQEEHEVVPVPAAPSAPSSSLAGSAGFPGTGAGFQVSSLGGGGSLVDSYPHGGYSAPLELPVKFYKGTGGYKKRSTFNQPPFVPVPSEMIERRADVRWIENEEPQIRY